MHLEARARARERERGTIGPRAVRGYQEQQTTPRDDAAADSFWKNAPTLRRASFARSTSRSRSPTLGRARSRATRPTAHSTTDGRRNRLSSILPAKSSRSGKRNGRDYIAKRDEMEYNGFRKYRDIESVIRARYMSRLFPSRRDT